ncbi:four helix bundle protein [bacterium]|nr:four helix bundle protein [bacterium]
MHHDKLNEQTCPENSLSYMNCAQYEKTIKDLEREDVFSFSSKWPKQHLYTLGTQIQRSALSVTLNIVEGNARFSRKDYRHFLIQSRGSLAETGYLVRLAYHLSLLPQDHYIILLKRYRFLSYLLQQLINSLITTP